MRVLFICKYNAGRSRMAEAIFNRISKKNRAISRGIGANPNAAAAKRGIRGTATVLKEIGISIELRPGRAVHKADVKNADKVVVLLDKKQRHILPRYITSSPKTRYYGVVDSDSRAKDFLDQQRRNRDIANRYVRSLVKKIG